MFKKWLVILGIIVSLLLVGGSSVFAKDPEGVSYKTHVQNEGWQGYVSNGERSGTEGQGLRLEAIKIKLAGYEDLSIRYKTHIENAGWEDWVSEGGMSGTEGMSYRLEGIKMELIGDNAERFDLYYKVHAQNFGDLGWAKNGEAAGTAGFGLRLEGIEIQILPKDGDPPIFEREVPFIEKGKVSVIFKEGDRILDIAAILKGRALDENAYQLERPGQIFKGWYLDRDFNEAYQFGTPLMNDSLVLHACFEADPKPPSLESYSWDEISLIASKGEGREHFNIGDEKKVRLRTGEEIVVQIVGFDHDERKDGGKAGITFGMKDVLKNTHKMGGQPNRDYFGGYRESEMQKHLDSRVFLNLPTDLAKAIVPVRKFTSSGYPDHQIEETTEGLFLFSSAEIGFFDFYEGALAGEGEIYEIFEMATSLPIKYDQEGKGAFWWLRSFNKYSNYVFLGVEDHGYPGDGACYEQGGIAFGFALGEEISYAVNYDSLGGTPIDDAVVVHNGLITEPADPTRADHAFEGWYRDPEFTTAYDFTNPVVSDLTLYAKWRATTALVSFEVSGGTSIPAIKVDRGASVDKPANPTKTDAIFNEWYTDADLENRYNFDTIIEADITLYSKWINKGAALDRYSWQEIGAISQAGRAPEFFKIGDIKNIVLNEKAHPFEIIGFDHDNQVAGGKAGITFASQTVVDSFYCRPLNIRKTNEGGWDASRMRGYLNNEMIGNLPTELQSQLVEVVKLTSNGSPTHQLIKSYDKLFLLSDTETCNVKSDSTLDGEGSLYPAFKGGEANIKRGKFAIGHPNLVSVYSLRSDVMVNDHDFYAVASHGTWTKQPANRASGLVFGFCI